MKRTHASRIAALIQNRHPAIWSVSVEPHGRREAHALIARIQAPVEQHAAIRAALTAATASFQPRGKTLTFQLLPPIGYPS